MKNIFHLIILICICLSLSADYASAVNLREVQSDKLNTENNSTGIPTSDLVPKKQSIIKVDSLVSNKAVINKLQKDIELSRNSKNITTLAAAYKKLSEQYEKQNNPKASFEYYRKYISCKDSISEIENSNIMAKLQAKYETGKKEQQLALLNTEKTIQNKVISKRKTQRNGFLAGSVLLLLIAGVAFNGYRIKKKTNQQLSSSLVELKQLQQQLIEKEKLASLGQLTAGISHEIQNPLNFIINFSQLNRNLLREWDNNADDELKTDIINDIRENAALIERHGGRANSIIQSMLMHSPDNNTFDREPTDVNELCKEALSFAWQAVSMAYPDFICNNVVIFKTGLPLVKLVKQDMLRVVINLLNNSFYAVREKVLDSKTGSTFNPEVKIETFFNQNKIHLRISDNGNGIAEEIKNKIFQPFFTTKPTHLGTGLGLSISNDITKANNGELQLESSNPSGTAFIISLPV